MNIHDVLLSMRQHNWCGIFMMCAVLAKHVGVNIHDASDIRDGHRHVTRWNNASGKWEENVFK